MQENIYADPSDPTKFFQQEDSTQKVGEASLIETDVFTCDQSKHESVILQLLRGVDCGDFFM